VPVNKDTLIVGDKTKSGVRKAVTLLKKFGSRFSRFHRGRRALRKNATPLSAHLRCAGVRTETAWGSMRPRTWTRTYRKRRPAIN
jgi:hypothetical protein